MIDVDCKHPPGKFIPVVDFSRCEAKGPCTQVCPYNVFEISKIEPADYAKLGLLSKLKNRGTRRKSCIHTELGPVRGVWIMRKGLP